MLEDESKISNIEWGLLVGVALTIDAIQILLEWMIIGFFINPFIDIFVTLSFGLFFHLKGESLANPKRLLAILGTFIGELIPVVAELPLWSLYVVYMWSMSKSDKILKNIPGGGVIDSIKKK